MTTTTDTETDLSPAVAAPVGSSGTVHVTRNPATVPPAIPPEAEIGSHARRAGKRDWINPVVKTIVEEVMTSKEMVEQLQQGSSFDIVLNGIDNRSGVDTKLMGLKRHIAQLAEIILREKSGEDSFYINRDRDALLDQMNAAYSDDAVALIGKLVHSRATKERVNGYQAIQKAIPVASPAG